MTIIPTAEPCPCKLAWVKSIKSNDVRQWDIPFPCRRLPWLLKTRTVRTKRTSHSRHVEDIWVEPEGSLLILICFMLMKEGKKERDVVIANELHWSGPQWGGWIAEMDNILHLLGEECFVSAFLGSISGAVQAISRQNHKILINVLMFNVYCMGLSSASFLLLLEWQQQTQTLITWSNISKKWEEFSRHKECRPNLEHVMSFFPACHEWIHHTAKTQVFQASFQHKHSGEEHQLAASSKFCSALQ